jgi:hypothetical protein
VGAGYHQQVSEAILSATVDFTTVTAAIKALTITGVDILDVSEIPSSLGLDTHVLAPMPEGFITNIELVNDELSQQYLTLHYTLTYRYYHCKIGGELLANYGGMIDKAAAILLAFSDDATLNGALDSDTPQIFNIGPVSDPSGNAYHGFDIALRITQFLEV